ncbi:MAG: hypothetical protein ACE5KM_18775, partial [Planctomycetaceae bacterium]
MRGSSLTTFLMFLPLIAIPLLAVFGVPEFSPVKASPPTEPQPQGLSVAGLDANATTPAARKPVNGIFDPGPADTNQKAADGLPAASTDPFTDNHSFADNHRRNKMGGWHLPPQQNGKSAGTQPPVPPRP